MKGRKGKKKKKKVHHFQRLNKKLNGFIPLSVHFSFISLYHAADSHAVTLH